MVTTVQSLTDHMLGTENQKMISLMCSTSGSVQWRTSLTCWFGMQHDEGGVRLNAKHRASHQRYHGVNGNRKLSDCLPHGLHHVR